ncbi:MAG: hypothetical protein Q8N77_01455 [Nanoarchaeota archaeon]|nr:hypothetical protein [Nanoarchaeota archaeon]
MVSQELLDYIKKELTRGVSEDKLRQVLLEYDWPEFEINEAFEKAREEIAEAPPEMPFEEAAKPEEQERLKESVEEKVEKAPLTEDVKRIVVNKWFIIAAVVIITGSVIFFALPSAEVEQETEGISSDALNYAEGVCRQYCINEECGNFINTGLFTHPELEGKNCVDLGIPCLYPNDEPKCETEY